MAPIVCNEAVADFANRQLLGEATVERFILSNSAPPVDKVNAFLATQN
jgi:hypothetical protein